LIIIASSNEIIIEIPGRLTQKITRNSFEVTDFILPSVSFNSNEQKLAIGWKNILRIYDINTLKPTIEIKCSKIIEGLAYLHNFMIATLT